MHSHHAAGLNVSGHVPRRITSMTIPSPEKKLLKMILENADSKPSKPEDLEEKATTSSTNNGWQCYICMQEVPQLTRKPIYAVTNCEHVFCYECALRLIFIIKRKKKDGKEEPVQCPFCCQTLTKVIMTRKLLETKEAVKQFLLQVKNEKLILYLDIVYYVKTVDHDLFEDIKFVISLKCLSCNFDVSNHLGKFKKDESTFKYLSKHLFDKHHKRFICELCFFNIGQLPIEIQDFSKSDLCQHLKEGSNVGDSFVKHQKCTLCPDSNDPTRPCANYYFNTEALRAHCKENHFSCYVCSPKTKETYFIDKEAVDDHIDTEHIVCPVCRRKGDIFGLMTITELKNHANSDHPKEKINYEELEKRSIERVAVDVAEDVDLIKAQIDKELRRSHNAQQQANPSFGSTTENKEKYNLHFPVTESSKVNEKKDGMNGHFLMASNYPKKQLFDGSNTEVDFPGLGEPSEPNGQKPKANKSPLVKKPELSWSKTVTNGTTTKQPHKVPTVTSLVSSPAVPAVASKVQPNLNAVAAPSEFPAIPFQMPQPAPKSASKNTIPPGLGGLTDAQRLNNVQQIKQKQRVPESVWNAPAGITQSRFLASSKPQIGGSAWISTPPANSTVKVINSSPNGASIGGGGPIVGKMSPLKYDDNFPSLDGGSAGDNGGTGSPFSSEIKKTKETNKFNRKKKL